MCNLNYKKILINYFLFNNIISEYLSLIGVLFLIIFFFLSYAIKCKDALGN